MSSVPSAPQKKKATSCIVTKVVVRKTLKTLAQTLATIDPTEEQLSLIFAELEQVIAGLKIGKIDGLLWEQAVSDLMGPEAYSLQRLNLWPK